MKRFFSSYKTVVCREGVYYTLVVLGVLFGAILRQNNSTILFSSLLVTPLFIAFWMSRKTIHHLTIKRKLPSKIHAGDTFVCQLEVTNNRPSISSWGIIVEDHIEFLNENGTEKEKKNDSHLPAVYFDYIRPQNTIRKNYIGRFPQRGRYFFKDLRLSTRFPCGFFRSWTQVSQETTLLVLPRIGKLAADWITRQHDATETVLRRRYRPSRVTGEFLGVREWQPGDTKRLVHWRSSARHNRLVVRQYEQHQNRDLIILLDLYCPDNVTPAIEENIELAISFAATLTSEIIRRGGCNLLFGLSQETNELYFGPTNAPLLEQILERLAVVRTVKEDHLSHLIIEMIAKADPNADVVVISHQPIQFNDPIRFAQIKHDARLRTLMQRIRVVVTSDKEFEKIFEVSR